MLTLFFVALLSYLLGSFPTSIVLSRVVKGIDIRNYGSGNAGGTNAFRVLGWKLGLIVTIFDIAKGFIATALFSQLQLGTTPPPLAELELKYLAGAFAIIGHIWTVFAQFRGGKGVATTAGMVLALFPKSFLTLLLLFLVIAALTRYVSLASTLSLTALPLIGWLYRRFGVEAVPNGFIALSSFIALLVIYTHRENIKRLFQGKESKFRGQETH